MKRNNERNNHDDTSSRADRLDDDAQVARSCMAAASDAAQFDRITPLPFRLRPYHVHSNAHRSASLSSGTSSSFIASMHADSSRWTNGRFAGSWM